MDALDARILRTLGIEPFVGWGQRPRGLKASDVARHLGKNVRLVQDRITRMESDGVIAGYGLFPNPLQFGLHVTTFHVLARSIPDERTLERLCAVDGFVGVVPYVGSGLCLTLSHATAAQQARRLELIGELLESEQEGAPLYRHEHPQVLRTLTPLDRRIMAALAPDARRPVAEVAQEVGVTVKTVRSRLAKMRDEGSFDEHVRLDFLRMTGILPFELAVWTDADASDVEGALVDLFRERYLAHFRPPPGGYTDVLMRIFAYTAAEVRSLAQKAAELPGVRRTEALMAAGAHFNRAWLHELLAAQTEDDAAALP